MGGGYLDEIIFPKVCFRNVGLIVHIFISYECICSKYRFVQNRV